MKEHNFFVSVKYGLSQFMYDEEWNATITGTEFDVDKLTELFRDFCNHIEKELQN